MNTRYGLGDQSRATCPDHKSTTAQDHEEGPDEIDGGEGGLPHEVGYEKPVDHTVDRGECHHDDGREGKAEELAVVEALR